MTDYYFDTSALVKRYIVETGSKWVKSLTGLAANNVVLIADITPTEVIAAIQKRLRQGPSNGGISAGAAANARLLFYRDLPRFYVVTMTPEILRVAQRLPLRHALRAYDAIQLATALVAARNFASERLPPPVFVAADGGLIAAAAAEGFQTDNPDAHA